ncbi:hypothetical protein EIP86_003261 [Pleurotus ostreatoroseus]|nr:hypothetical protein EIP86_003261 [Pleurotus ostreatoroseus]
MTLPANDAFSLGLTGSHDPTRPAYTLSLRSTSPKIPFVSSRARSPPSHSQTLPRKTARRAMSNGSANGNADGLRHEPSHEHHTSPPSILRSQDDCSQRVDKLNGAPLSRKVSSPRTQTATSPTTDVARPKQPVAPPIDWEIPRKILHSSIAPADVLRLNHSGFERFYEKCLGFLMRESEKKSTNGVIWYIIGVIWVLGLYPLDVAVVSILVLSWADTAASTIGRLWGRYTPRLPARLPILGLPLAPRKSVAGFIAGSVTGAVITAGFWGALSTVGNITPIWSWAGGVTGTGVLTGWVGLGIISVVNGIISGVSEALDLGSLDDNLTLPIISGGCMLCFFKCIQYFFS